MASEYTVKEVDQIIKAQTDEYPKNFALAAAWVLADFKGINLKIIDMQGTSSLADYYVLASSENTTTSKSMASDIQMHFKRNGVSINSVEGTDDAEWILVDCGDLIVHIFLDTVREVFDLDNLWRENPQVEIPQEYYFSNKDSAKSTESEEAYF